MDGTRKLERRSSKESSMKKLEAKKKASPRNPLKELNGTSVPPPPGSSEVRRGGCFGFVVSNSSSNGPIQRSKSISRTPQSAPSNRRMVAVKSSKKDLRYQTSQNTALKSNLEVVKKPGGRKNSKPRAPDLLDKWNKRNSSSIVDKSEEKCDFESSLGAKVGSCPASTPEKSFSLGFTDNLGFAAAIERGQKLTCTPTSANTPPIEASISPEVPIGASDVAATPARFAAGHVIAGVHDRRKCRPRGLLTVGRNEADVSRILDGKTDATRASLTPPIAEASIHWLSSPLENIDSGVGSSLGLSSRARLARCMAETSVNWFISPSEDGDKDEVYKDEYFSTQKSAMGNETSTNHELWRFSPSSSSMSGSPKPIGLLGLNNLVFETTPSSGISVQKTPTTGGSISPFSMILERASKTSKSKLVRPQQELGRHHYGSSLESSMFSGISSTNGNIISTTSADSCSKEQVSLSPSVMNQMVEVLGNVSFSPEIVTTNISTEEILPEQSFQFECQPLSLNSVELKHFQKPACKSISPSEPKEQDLPNSGVRISWREGLTSRIFDSSELGYCNWFSDEDDSFNEIKDGKLESNFNLKVRSFILESDEDQPVSKGFGSIEFALEAAAQKSDPKVPLGSIEFASEAAAQKSDPKVPSTGHVTCAESISTDGLELVSSGDSDWTLFYKNHLFEV